MITTTAVAFSYESLGLLKASEPLEPLPLPLSAAARAALKTSVFAALATAAAASGSAWIGRVSARLDSIVTTTFKLIAALTALTNLDAAVVYSFPLQTLCKRSSNHNMGGSQIARVGRTCLVLSGQSNKTQHSGDQKIKGGGGFGCDGCDRHCKSYGGILRNNHRSAEQREASELVQEYRCDDDGRADAKLRSIAQRHL